MQKVGILGLAAVVVHRQKKKHQLKALLRAKNLGTVLETREIAQGISKKYNLENRLPRYTQVRKEIHKVIYVDGTHGLQDLNYVKYHFLITQLFIHI